MQFIIDEISKNEEYNKLITAVRKNQLPAMMWGAPDYLRAAFCYTLCKKAKKKALVIVPELELEETILAFKAHFKENVATYSAKEYQFLNVDTTSHTLENERLRVLQSMANDEYEVIITTIRSLCDYTISKKDIINQSLILKQDMEFPLEKLTRHLADTGYVSCSRVEGIGQFSVRGGICDFYSPDATAPVRAEFFGDTVDAIATFDIISQRRQEKLKSVKISPASQKTKEENDVLIEGLKKLRKKFSKNEKVLSVLEEDIEKLSNGIHICTDRYISLSDKKNTILDFIEDNFVFCFEFAKEKETLKGSTARFLEDVNQATELGMPFSGNDFFLKTSELYEKLQSKNLIIFERLSRSEDVIKYKTLLSINAVSCEYTGGEFEVIAEDIEHFVNNRNGRAVVATANPKHAENITNILNALNVKASFTLEENFTIKEKTAVVIVAPFLKGYILNKDKFALFTAINTAKKAGKERRALKKFKSGVKITSLADLKPGDYVVHNEYGIGVFEGIVTNTYDGVTKDSLKIRYAGTDTLYVPCSRLDLISKYLGADVSDGVKLNKLTRNDFEKVKARVKSAVKDLANELIKLYAERMVAKGYAFSKDTTWQKEFEDSFPFEETDDQLICIDEVKKDMEKSMPMERLLCGDVGVGKTEVAIRAAFKAVADNKQVAVLVPTTVLAMQHYRTFLNRMSGFPIKIEMLSRYKTKKQQTEIEKELIRGQIDILIGTHKIIQKNIAFKDLGLVIIDEEQRFGVSHKEKLKEMTKNIDILTLSATPIPRTLNMALSGIRDMSVIDTPPHDRVPIITYVAEFDYSLVCDAIIKELSRGGQVYYLCNRIDKIYEKAAKLKELIPSANIDVAHGRMSQAEISEVWEALLDGKIDILVCTTIIETGVDVSNVNTIIIEDADKLGLAQLHQIRGRVGRSARKAYAFLTYYKGKVLSDDAAKRLTAIRQYTEFGSGLKIAMRDLEIRGAGNVLGAKQSGHMEAVGYDLYSQLLKEAIDTEKGEVIKIVRCTIDLNITAFIPTDFIKSAEDRIDIYKIISSIKNENDAKEVTLEIKDRFGKPPKAVLNLIDVAILKQIAASLDIEEIIEKGTSLVFYPQYVDLKLIADLSEYYKKRIFYTPASRSYITLNIAGKQSVEELRSFLEIYTKLIAKF
ncbi:MAG: transcription-repair coupling factor [Clostridia bacterium]